MHSPSRPGCWTFVREVCGYVFRSLFRSALQSESRGRSCCCSAPDRKRRVLFRSECTPHRGLGAGRLFERFAATCSGAYSDRRCSQNRGAGAAVVRHQIGRDVCSSDLNALPIEAWVLDVCSRGLRLRVPEPIPIGAAVRIEAQELLLFGTRSEETCALPI